MIEQLTKTEQMITDQEELRKWFVDCPREEINPPIKILHDGKAYLGVARISVMNGTVVEAIDEVGKVAYLCGGCAEDGTAHIH